MALQYNGESDSVRYLTTADWNAQAQTAGHKSTKIFSTSVWTVVTKKLSTLPWDRVITILALTLSILAVTLNVSNFTGASKQLPDAGTVSALTGDYPSDAKEYDGSGMEDPTTDLLARTIDEIVERRMNRTDLELKRYLDSRISQLSSQLDNTNNASNLQAMLLKLTSIDQLQNDTGTRLENVESRVRVIGKRLTKLLIDFDRMQLAVKSSEANVSDQWKMTTEVKNEQDKTSHILEIVGPKIAALEKLPDILNDTKRSLASLNSNVASFKSAFASNKMSSWQRFRSLQQQITSLKATHNTTARVLRSLENRLQNVKPKIDSLRVVFQSKLTGVSSKLATLQATLQRQGKTLANQNVVTRTIESNVANLKQATTTKIQQANSWAHTQITNMPKRWAAEINTAEKRLNTAIQSLSPRGINTFESSLKNFNSTITGLKLALQGKADRGWIQAPNGCSYHITQVLFTSWFDAREKCQKLGSKLAYMGPRNSYMQKFLFENLVEARGEGAWIGLTDLATEHVWKWSDGVHLHDKAPWATGQPNNLLKSSKDQDCAEINIKGGGWNDLWCNSEPGKMPRAALCEKKL